MDLVGFCISYFSARVTHWWLYFISGLKAERVVEEPRWAMACKLWRASEVSKLLRIILSMGFAPSSILGAKVWNPLGVLLITAGARIED